MSIITISSIFENDFDNFCDFCGNACVSFLIDTTGYETGLTEYIFRPIWFRYLETPIKFSNDDKGKEAFLRNFCNQLNEVVFDFYTYCKENIDYFMYQTNPLNEGKPMSKNIATGINPINQTVDQAVDSTNLASGTTGQYISETVYNGVAWHKLVDGYFTPNRKTALLKAFQWLFVSVYSPETKYDDKIEEKREVDLLFVDDDNNIINVQEVYPTKSYFTMSQVDINRPLNLDPQNIKKDVDIAGIVGTYEPNIYPRIYDLLRLDNPDGVIVYNTPSGYDGLEGVTITIPDSALPENIKDGVNIGGIIGTYAGSVDYLPNNIMYDSNAPYNYITDASLTSLRNYAFFCDVNIRELTLTNVTTVQSTATFKNSGLTKIEMPALTIMTASMYNSAFGGCANLETANFPNVVTIDSYNSSIFAGCEKLKYVDFSSLSTIASGVNSIFSGCIALETIDLNNANRINTSTFAGCTSLTDITLKRTSTVTLQNVNAIPTGQNIKIHVPSSLISSYEVASNWATLYNNGDITFVGI